MGLNIITEEINEKTKNIFKGKKKKLFTGNSLESAP